MAHGGEFLHNEEVYAYYDIPQFVLITQQAVIPIELEKCKVLVSITEYSFKLNVSIFSSARTFTASKNLTPNATFVLSRIAQFTPTRPKMSLSSAEASESDIFTLRPSLMLICIKMAQNQPFLDVSSCSELVLELQPLKTDHQL